MEPHQLLQADLLDILFEGRDKDYGAYDLRKTYNKRLNKAILITLSLCLLLIFGYVLAGNRNDTHHPVYVTDGGLIAEIEPVHKEEKPVTAPRLAHKQTPQPVATINASAPRIVPNDQVDPNERPHTTDEMNDAKLGTMNRTGIPVDNTGPVAPSNSTGTGLLNAPAQGANIDDTTFRAVEIQSYFKGGPEAWKRFLLSNFHTPDEALANQIQGTVTVQFIVDKQGNVSDVLAIGGPEELKGEAVRVIKKSGKWEPAIQNGRHVNSYKKQLITVLLRNGD